MTRPNDAAYATPTVPNLNGQTEWGEYGLTKREHMATIICAGLAADGGYHKFQDMTDDTVKITDTLIQSLNKETK